MTEKLKDVEINQKSSMGSQTTQIGVQNVYNGLSVSDVIQTAFSLFEEYYPQLREEALCVVREMVEKEMEKVQSEDIVSPKPKIAIPILQNASITDENELRILYAKLLASAMDKNTVSIVHPAYVSIINQLSAKDALLLKKIVDINDSIPVAHVKFTFGDRCLANVPPHFYSPYFKELEDMENISSCIENLSRLQLINLFEGNVVAYNYAQIENDSYIQEQYEYAKRKNPTRDLKIKVDSYVIQLNDFGKKFIKVCMSQDV